MIEPATTLTTRQAFLNARKERAQAAKTAWDWLFGRSRHET